MLCCSCTLWLIFASHASCSPCIAHICVCVCIYIYHDFIAPHLLLMHHFFLIFYVCTHTHTHAHTHMHTHTRTHTHTLLFLMLLIRHALLDTLLLRYFAVKLTQCSRRMHMCINII